MYLNLTVTTYDGLFGGVTIMSAYQQEYFIIFQRPYYHFFSYQRNWWFFAKLFFFQVTDVKTWKKNLKSAED